MKLEILPVYRRLQEYVAGAESNPADAAVLWERYAVEPYWKLLSCYAPFDLSARKPQPILDIPARKIQLERLGAMDLRALQAEFEETAALLPADDDDTIYVALYPLSDDRAVVKERQNGVLGDSLFGNIAIHVNPLAEDFAAWIPYVFAHEYHHAVWGGYWYVRHGGELAGEFVDSLLSEGQADSFALSRYPDLRPEWLFSLSDDQANTLWADQYAGRMFLQDVDTCKYMFGDEAGGIPWCAGYAVGFGIVQAFLRKHPGTTARQLLEIRPADILKQSGYGRPRA